MESLQGDLAVGVADNILALLRERQGGPRQPSEQEALRGLLEQEGRAMQLVSVETMTSPRVSGSMELSTEAGQVECASSGLAEQVTHAMDDAVARLMGITGQERKQLKESMAQVAKMEKELAAMRERLRAAQGQVELLEGQLAAARMVNLGLPETVADATMQQLEEEVERLRTDLSLANTLLMESLQGDLAVGVADNILALLRERQGGPRQPSEQEALRGLLEQEGRAMQLVSVETMTSPRVSGSMELSTEAGQVECASSGLAEQVTHAMDDAVARLMGITGQERKQLKESMAQVAKMEKELAAMRERLRAAQGQVELLEGQLAAARMVNLGLPETVADATMQQLEEEVERLRTDLSLANTLLMESLQGDLAVGVADNILALLRERQGGPRQPSEQEALRGLLEQEGRAMQLVSVETMTSPRVSGSMELSTEAGQVECASSGLAEQVTHAMDDAVARLMGITGQERKQLKESMAQVAKMEQELAAMRERLRAAQAEAEGLRAQLEVPQVVRAGSSEAERSRAVQGAVEERGSHDVEAGQMGEEVMGAQEGRIAGADVDEEGERVRAEVVSLDEEPGRRSAEAGAVMTATAGMAVGAGGLDRQEVVAEEGVELRAEVLSLREEVVRVRA
ncbi:hypothetical protein CYMTET_36103, partial [Cymbomonas tetramitiformis]